MARKEYSGTAIATKLNATLSNVGTSFSTDAAIGFPAGTNPFVVTIGRGTSTEEKVLCSSRSGTTFTVSQRGYDGTIAVAHAAGDSVHHTLDANTVDEANAHVNDDTRDDHSQYMKADGTRHDLAARHDHGTQGGLTDDDHQQYYNEARHTKAVHDALLIDAATLDGLDSTSFSQTTHTHDTLTPIGASMEWNGSADPAGGTWMIEDGRAISRTTFATLFSVVGTKFGAGDGSTTFNIPNSKGRVTVGLDSAVTDFNDRGKTGGSKTHVLTQNEMPSHTHTQNSHDHGQDAHAHGVNDPGHVHDGPNQFVITASTDPHKLGTTGQQVTFTDLTASSGTGISIQSATANNHETTATNQNTGGGAAHENMPPYIVKNKIIRVL